MKREAKGQAASGEPMQPIIDRLRALAMQGQDALLLAEGPPPPDHELLALCGEALHHLVAARKAIEEWQQLGRDSGARQEALDKEGDAHIGAAHKSLRRAKKLRAASTAGIYSKALCVKASRTGAKELAMSLAADLVALPALQRSLWAAEVESPAPASGW